MKTIGGLLISKQPALNGELVIRKVMANRTQSSDRAVGGILYVTNLRLLFNPHLVDYNTGGEQWSARLMDIVGFSVQDQGRDVLGGGLRKRLRVKLKDGSEELFVVNKLAQVLEFLNEQLGPR